MLLADRIFAFFCHKERTLPPPDRFSAFSCQKERLVPHPDRFSAFSCQKECLVPHPDWFSAFSCQKECLVPRPDRFSGFFLPERAPGSTSGQIFGFFLPERVSGVTSGQIFDLFLPSLTNSVESGGCSGKSRYAHTCLRAPLSYDAEGGTFFRSIPLRLPSNYAPPSLGVLANGPQTTETRKNGVWGAGGWTANDGKRVKALFVEQREKYFWQATLGYGAGRRERIIFRV